MGADIEELKKKIAPIGNKYELEAVYLFGSMARGDAGPDSDYDFYIEGDKIKSMFTLGGLFADMKEVLNSEVDIVLKPGKYGRLEDYMIDAIQRDGVKVYG